MSEKILEIKDERLSFFTPAGEVKALNGVSFSMNQGDVLGIVGESGSGKSVTAYSIMGLTAYPGRLVGGTVWFNGHQIDKMTEKEFRKIRGNEVSIIFQDPMTALNPVMTVGSQIAESIQLHQNVDAKEAMEKAKEMLRTVGISDSRAGDYPHQFSGGMKQRVGIARSYCIEPKVLLMDEPFGALDAQTRYLMQQELDRIWQTDRRTIVFVTNNIEEALYLADRIVVISNCPATVKKEYVIDMPRPRNYVSPEFLALRKEITSIVDKTM